MTVTLAKGGNFVLEAEAPGIAQVRVGIGWTSGPGSGAIEIDGLLSLVEEGGGSGRLVLVHQVPNPDESVAAPPGPVVGDAERLVVTLAAGPPSVTRLQFGATIYDANARRQTFRSVRGAYIRVVNHANGIELGRYTLDVETGSETAMVFGELYRNPRGWKFRAVGQGYAAGLRGIAGGSGEPHSARPGEVTDYLRRISPARSRRSLAEHLDPSHAAPPAPPAPSTRPAAHAKPPAAQAKPPAAQAKPPSTQRSPAQARPSQAPPSRATPSQARPRPPQPAAP